MHRLIWGFADSTHLIVGNLMSRLNYIISRHRTQSRTFAYMINSAPDLVTTMEIFCIQTICKLWKQVVERERERERERETSACIRISCNLEKFHVSVLKMILGDASRAHRLLHDKVGYSKVLMLCMLLSHAQMFKLMKHYFLNSIRIWSGSELWQRFFPFFFKGERIQISLKADHHRPEFKWRFAGVPMMAQRWMLAW